jgi:hypothetical protein
VVAIVRRLTQQQYQALALFLNALTGDQHKPQDMFQDYHTDKDSKLTQTK